MPIITIGNHPLVFGVTPMDLFAHHSRPIDLGGGQIAVWTLTAGGAINVHSSAQPTAGHAQRAPVIFGDEQHGFHATPVPTSSSHLRAVGGGLPGHQLRTHFGAGPNRRARSDQSLAEKPRAHLVHPHLRGANGSRPWRQEGRELRRVKSSRLVFMAGRQVAGHTRPAGAGISGHYLPKPGKP